MANNTTTECEVINLILLLGYLIFSFVMFRCCASKALKYNATKAFAPFEFYLAIKYTGRKLVCVRE
jgi:hypothetical protein